MSITRNSQSHLVDIAIVGGGIAGAWLLHLLSRRGYSVVLFESGHLGCDQTLASQGMIHGGMKYALSGRLTTASEAIAAMPSRWRACLSGTGEVDLTGLRLLHDHYYMFAAGSTLGRLTAFFASRALRGRITKLEKQAWPAGFTGYDGIVYALDDFVVDPAHLLAKLCEPYQDRITRARVTGADVQMHNDGCTIDAGGYRWQARRLLCCAGNGSAALMAELGITSIRTQTRPLKQVIARTSHRTELYAHCLTDITTNEPRLTITSRNTHDGTTWYLGGLLATQGVHRSDAEQVQFARQELLDCLPWLDWTQTSLTTLDVDRAEPKHTGERRLDEAYVGVAGAFVQCLPTKLTLAPDLGDKVLAILDPPNHAQPPVSLPGVAVGRPPW